ncbi:MAG: M56 family metallopeptidase, partial [Vicinamibacterales bacterium]
MTSDLLLGPYAQALAWTLVHFLWQGALIGLVAVWLMRMPRVGASARYTIGVTALAAMLAAPVATMAWIGSTPEITARRVAPIATTSVRPSARVTSPPIAGLKVLEPVEPVAPAEPVEPVLPAVPLLVLWLAGVVVLSGRLLGNWLAVRRLIGRSVRPVDSEIHRLARRVAGRLALDRVVRVCESTAVAVPMMVGWLKPVVLLPASAIAGLAPTQIEALIAHEFAHVRRHDYLVNLLQSVVETLLFYHPAVWWVSRRVRAEREHCCDDLVVGVCDRLAYVTALADLAAIVVHGNVALAASDGSLLTRVRRILGVAGDERLASGSVSALVALLVAGLLLPVGLVFAQGPARTVASTPQPQTAATGASASVTQQTSGGGSGRFTWQDTFEKVSIKWSGKFRVSDDDKDIDWVEPGGTVEVSDGGWVLTTGVMLRGTPDGSVQRSYRRNGFERPYEPEGREYLATALIKVIRRSGFGAESRVARFLKQGGVDAVFTEIAQLEGDYVRRIYYTELIKQATLSPAELTRVARQASQTISSDYELGTLLQAAGKQAVGDEGALVALIEATGTIGSDYEQHQALAALLPSEPSPNVAAALLRAASGIGSDYERASLLIELTRHGGLSSA